jgi:hypothetical protein
MGLADVESRVFARSEHRADRRLPNSIAFQGKLRRGCSDFCQRATVVVETEGC